MSAIKTLYLKPTLFCQEDANHRDYKNLIYGQEVKRTVPIYQTFYMGYFLANPQEFKKRSAACKLISLGYDIKIGLNNEARWTHAEGHFYVIPFIEQHAILGQKDEFTSTKKTFYSPNHPSILEDFQKKRYYSGGRISPNTKLPQYTFIQDAQLLTQPITDKHNLFGNKLENSSIGISIYLYNPNQVLVPYFFVKDAILRCKYESASYITFKDVGVQDNVVRVLAGDKPYYKPEKYGYILRGWEDDLGNLYPVDNLPLATDIDKTYKAVWGREDLYIGTEKPKAIFVGNRPVKEVYLGNRLIFK